MTDNDRINSLIVDLIKELSYYAEKIMHISTDNEVDAFISGYCECIFISDQNTNEQHEINSLTLHIKELKKALEANEN